MRRFPGILVAAHLPAVVVLLLSPAPGGAGPVAHLAWDDCGAAGVVTRTFACNTNVGAEQLVVSFVPPEGTVAFTGIEARVRFWPPLGSLPSWWALSTGGCRSGSLRSLPSSAGPSPCASPWTNGTFSAADLSVPDQELRAIADLPKGAEHGLDSTIEYYGLRIAFNHAKSAGDGACDGCSMPVGMCLSRLSLLLGPPDPTFDFPLPELPYVNWQCDGSPILSSDHQVTGWNFSNCATAARGQTWGRIKALYR
jgi:hypothetical protein